MANGLNTLNLIQVKGGVNIKQGDSKSILEYELGYSDGSDMMTDLGLDGEVAKITLYNRLINEKWTTDSVVRGNRVSFTIDEALKLGIYVLDIDVAGHIFPSDREMYVKVHEGYQSYIDAGSAAVAVATAKNIANEAIRLAVLENAETIRGPKGNPGDSIKVADVTKSGTSNIVTFSDGKTLTVEDGESVFVESYRILDDGNTEIVFTDGKTAIIKKGDDSKIVSSEYDSSGNTIISFNNGSPDVTVQRGKQGLKGDTGNPVNVASVTKSGTTNTVKFTDGKTMIVEDGKNVSVSSTKILDDGNTEITFTDGKKAIVNKGDKGYTGPQGPVGPQGPQGVASKVTGSEYDSSGNTIISFNNGSPDITVKRGKTGEKGDTGDPVNVASVTKSGTTNTVKFTDGKTMIVEDGESVNVSSTKILDDGNTEITFTDGKKAIVNKGVDGTVKFDDLTTEQVNMLKVPVVDDLTTGGSDKALSAEQGKVLFNTIVKYHPDAKPKVMTAVIDQANSNPLTCITYEDDAKMMEKGSSEWDDFFRSQLVLFKDGKEVRELEDSELSELKPEDGDVMVRFPRKGLRIKTVGEKVYVSMTNKTDDPDFKYYAHSRGDSPRDAFYLGAYLGFEESGKLRSITEVKPVNNKGISEFRQLGQAVGDGYEISGFYQLTFLQAMYVLKYGNLDSQTAIGKGLTSGGEDITNTTGRTNGKGIDYGTQSDKEQMKFQYLEDFWGNRYWAIDGISTDSSCTLFTSTDKFNDSRSGYLNTGEKGVDNGGYLSKVFGTSELGFVGKTLGGSSSSYYCDFSEIRSNYFMFFGGGAFQKNQNTYAGAFFYSLYYGMTEANWSLSARLMFL